MEPFLVFILYTFSKEGVEEKKAIGIGLAFRTAGGPPGGRFPSELTEEC